MGRLDVGGEGGASIVLRLGFNFFLIPFKMPDFWHTSWPSRSFLRDTSFALGQRQVVEVILVGGGGLLGICLGTANKFYFPKPTDPLTPPRSPPLRLRHTPRCSELPPRRKIAERRIMASAPRWHMLRPQHFADTESTPTRARYSTALIPPSAHQGHRPPLQVGGRRGAHCVASSLLLFFLFFQFSSLFTYLRRLYNTVPVASWVSRCFFSVGVNMTNTVWTVDAAWRKWMFPPLVSDDSAVFDLLVSRKNTLHLFTSIYFIFFTILLIILSIYLIVYISIL